MSSNAKTIEDQTGPVNFDDSMIRARGVSKEYKGGQANVRFVGNTHDVKVLQDLTMQCVKRFTKDLKAAFCFGYGSDTDYAVKSPDWAPEADASAFGGARPCWVVYAGQALADSEPAIIDTLPGDIYNSPDSPCKGGMTFPS